MRIRGTIGSIRVMVRIRRCIVATRRRIVRPVRNVDRIRINITIRGIRCTRSVVLSVCVVFSIVFVRCAISNSSWWRLVV